MGLNSVLPLEGAGSAIKNLFAGSNEVAGNAPGSDASAKGGFLALLQKIIPEDPEEILTENGFVTAADADGRFAAFSGLGGLAALQSENRSGGNAVTGGATGAAADLLSGTLKIPAAATNPLDATPQIAPPLDGALPIAGDIAENGARLYGRAGEAFERYLANSSGSGEGQTLAGDARQARPTPPSVNLALAAGGLSNGRGEGGLSIPAEIFEAEAGGNVPAGIKTALAVSSQQPPQTGSSANGANGPGQTSFAHTPAGQTLLSPASLNPADSAATSGPALPEPTLFGPAGAAVQSGRDQSAGGLNPAAGLASSAGIQGQAAVQAARVNGSSTQPANNALSGGLSELTATDGETDGDINGDRPAVRRGFAASGNAGTGASGAVTGSSQASLRNAVSPAAQKFAAILAKSGPDAAAAGGNEPVGAILPGEGVAKVDNGFATLSPQNTPESSTARSLSPAIVSAAAGIARGAAQGENRFTIRLDPPELGRVDVRLKIGDDGIARAHLIVERSETLDLFMRDQRSLERSLEQAGVKTDANSLQFSLEGGEQGTAFAQSDDEGSSVTGRGEAEDRADGDDGTGDGAARAATRSHDGQLNITI